MKGKVGGYSERRFSWKFLGPCYGFLPFFSSLLLVGFERSLHPAQVRGQKCPWLLKLMTFTSGRGNVLCRSAQVVMDGSGVNRLSSPLFCVDALF